MLSKKSIIVLTILLLICTGFLVYLYFKGRELSKQVLDKDQITNQVVNITGNPVKKTVLQDKSGIDYQINGNLISDPVLRPDGAYNAKLIIKGDGLKRQIPIILGLGSKQILFGKYQKSFSGESTWGFKHVGDIVSELKPGEDIEVHTRLIYSDSSEQSSYFDKTQYALDEIISEFNRNLFVLKLADDFILVIEKIGVVR